MTAIMVFKASDAELSDYGISTGLLIVLNFAPIVFLKALNSRKEALATEEAKKSFGSIYIGKNTNEKTGIKAYMFPMAFFWRRTLFVVVTIFLFDWPSMQHIAHQVLNLITLVFLIADNTAYETVSQRVIEVGSELFLHLTSIMLAQFADLSYTEEELDKIEVVTLLFFSCLIILNIVFIIHVAIQDCKEKKRKKIIAD